MEYNNKNKIVEKLILTNDTNNMKENLKKDDLIVLFDNIQFIYELVLSQLELKSLNVDFDLLNSLREFKTTNDYDKNNLIKRASYFKTVDKQYTDYYYIIHKNVTRSINQYLTHWIYPYKGKFHPQMIRALLNIIEVKKGNTILDPFNGSGTTALESQLLGINYVGIDVSPLCILQTNVKTQSIFAINEIEKIKANVLDKIYYNNFNTDVKSFIEFLDNISNEKVKDFYKMAFLLYVSDNARRKINFDKSFYKNLDLMIKSVRDFQDIVQKLNLVLGDVKILNGDCRKLPLDDNCMDGIITSPPYSIALDYVANDAHSLKVLGYDISEIRENFIGVRGHGLGKIDLYNDDMKKSYDEMYRVLKPKKFVAIIIGNASYMGEEIKTVEFTIDYCQKIGFKLIHNIDKIIFGLYNVMQKENILIFQKI
ncbi:MAG: DNA methyltransferase [Caldisericia bacterium]|nr:DNA methyltransferase [Caldisericia bacterium]